MGVGMPNKVQECRNTTPSAIKLRNSENHSSQHANLLRVVDSESNLHETLGQRLRVPME